MFSLAYKTFDTTWDFCKLEEVSIISIKIWHAAFLYDICQYYEYRCQVNWKCGLFFFSAFKNKWKIFYWLVF